MTSRPSGPPSSADRGSNDAAIGSPAIASVRTYGRFATTTSSGAPSSGRTGGSRSASTKRIAVGRPRDRPRSRGRGRARPGDSVGREDRARRGPSSRAGSRSADGERDRDRPAAGADVGDPDRIAAPARAGAGLAGRSASRRIDLGDRRVDERLRLRPRDQRPRVDREGEPVELLDPADVGDRLAGRAAASSASSNRAAASGPTGASGWARIVVRSAPIAQPSSTSASSRARLGAGLAQPLGRVREQLAGSWPSPSPRRSAGGRPALRAGS